MRLLLACKTRHHSRPNAKILLRLFVHFHGDKVVLLLHGYNKGGNDSARRQSREIQEARKRLTHWKLAESKRRKKS